jgi:hypothetical protein
VAVFEGLAVLAAKIASASTVVQATAGFGIAVAGVTGAGAAGILPGALQDDVAGAVESVSPFDLPDSGDETRDSGTDGPGDVPGADATDIATPSAGPSAPTSSQGVEPGDDGGVHQNRGGTAAPTAAVRTDDSRPETVNSGRHHPEDDGPTAGTSSSAAHSAEVEDHDDDRSGHGRGGDDSRDDSSGDSPGHGGGDSSGHGGGDDD